MLLYLCVHLKLPTLLCLLVLLAGYVPAKATEWDFKLREGLIWVDVQINGSKPLHFLLDSAATSHVVDSKTAADLDLDLSDKTIEVRRTDSNAEHLLTQPVTLSVGPKHLPSAPLLVMPLNQPGCECARIDGILGLPLFEKFLVQIDYQMSKIRLLPRAERAGLKETSAVPLVIQEGLAGIRLADSRGRHGLFVVDTGFSRGIAVGTHARQAFAKGSQPRQSVLYAGGEIPVTFYDRTTWKIGNRTVQGVEAAFCKELAAGLLADSRWAGLVGNDFLARFTVTFDLPGHRMFLEPAN